MATGRSEHYFRLSENHRSILKAYFERGVTSCSAKNATIIEKAALEASISVERVKKWIGNERASLKRKAPPSDDREPEREDSATPLKIPSSNRGPTSFNVFCAELFKRDEYKHKSMAEKNALVAQEWKCLSVEEQDPYKEKAKSSKEVNVESLKEDERRRLIKKSRLRIMNELEYLSNLGCHSAMMLLDVANGELMAMGSDEGLQFLSANDQFQFKFQQYMACDKKKHTVMDVQMLFNSKYSEAVGKPSRVPYQKGNFKVHNMPEGVMFKRPYGYGRKQLHMIMEAKDKIRFEINARSSNEPVQDDGPNQLDQHQPSTSTDSLRDDDAFQHLLKIVDQSVIERAVNGEKIKESDVDVINLKLSEQERLELQCSPLLDMFSEDALLALDHNIQHSDDAGLVIPVDSGELDGQTFWLFYVTSSPKSIAHIGNEASINGIWLDLISKDPEKVRKYRLLTNHPDSINGISIIKSSIGPLYLSTKLPLKKGTIFTMPPFFHKSITKVLQYN